MAKVVESITENDLLGNLWAHDRNTYHHSKRVADMLVAFSSFIGLPSEEIENAYTLGIYHDIGKLLIPQEVLTKKDKLNEEEFQLIRNHPIAGYNLLKEREDNQAVLCSLLYHHENRDGTGYPYGLVKNQIPQLACMLRIVDSFDALTNDRSYAKAVSVTTALQELDDLKGFWYEPQLVVAFTKMIKEFS